MELLQLRQYHLLAARQAQLYHLEAPTHMGHLLLLLLHPQAHMLLQVLHPTGAHKVVA